MRPARRLGPLVVTLAALLLILIASVQAKAENSWPDADRSEPGVTIIGFQAKVTVAEGRECRIDADLIVPDGVDADHPAPAVLGTHGFGQDRSQDRPTHLMMAREGYVVLAYDALGFGGSTCKLGLDDPEWDGRAASQLVDFLGGKDGIAFTDKEFTEPLALPAIVQHDATDRDGTAHEFDPRVGMFGTSYGGAVQFATASVDTRVDAIVPITTWHNLTDALMPNHAEPQDGVVAPGITKTTWGLGVLAFGQLAAVQNFEQDPYRALGCAMWREVTCGDIVAAATQGYGSRDLRSYLNQIAPETSLQKVRTPTLLIQGQKDTLFDLNASLANRETLLRAGAPVTLIWTDSGHNGVNAREWDATNPARGQYLVDRAMTFLDHWLKDADVDTGPDFAYYRSWADKEDADIAEAYATADAPDPTGHTRYQFSGKGLAKEHEASAGHRQSFLTGVGALPTSIRPLDPLGNGLDGTYPDVDFPGTYTSWRTEELTRAVEVAGTPKVKIKINTDAEGWRADPDHVGAKPNLFLRLYDVGPDGKRHTIRNLATPVRINDTREIVEVTMAGIVHRFEPGHRIELVLAGGDLNYRGQVMASVVTVDTSREGQSLSLPTVG
ncbi:CocE/NonD family hydrolase [Propionibacteriaceae bacterium Y1700]|uniref:CocE/NonD family hydrolase n=1 Tax=Microlunatus sp. Y1700 TaxID=3418487 RepID=UPI003DA78166